VLSYQRDEKSFAHQRSGAEYFLRVSLRRGRASAEKRVDGSPCSRLLGQKFRRFIAEEDDLSSNNESSYNATTAKGLYNFVIDFDSLYASAVPPEDR